VSELVYWPLLAFCLTAVCIWLMLKTGLAGRLALDQPSARSLHSSSLPRSGGVVMMAMICLASLPASNEFTPTIGLALVLAIVSLLDDRVGLPVIPRLTIHIACAALGIFLVMPETQPAVSLLLILLLLWSTNLYNFMDGANGLVGGASVIGFGFLGWGFFLAGYMNDAAICWIIAMSAAGFFLFNADPAKIFMGDAGSIPLGFLAGIHGILGWARDAWPAWFPLLIFSPLLIDATLTLLGRILRGETFWEPHCEHAYQRLIRMGWRHKHVAGAYHGWMLAAGGVAAFLLSGSGAFATLIAVIVLLATVWAFFGITQKWGRFQRLMR
jgi:UDP-N-acetylmuramyl pentapeptide phosphotransferase/UDP-N-acetylglucosamine-1-phosphate transferase